MKNGFVRSRRLAAILVVAVGSAAFASGATAAPPYKPRKSDTGPGTQTEDDAYVGVRRK